MRLFGADGNLLSIAARHFAFNLFSLQYFDMFARVPNANEGI